MQCGGRRLLRLSQRRRGQQRSDLNGAAVGNFRSKDYAVTYRTKVSPSQRLIPTSERSGLLTRTAATENAFVVHVDESRA